MKLTVGITVYKESLEDLNFSISNLNNLNDIKILIHVDNNKELFHLIKQELPFLEIIESDTNVGLGESRNKLIKSCSTEWITFLDCKDQLNDDILSREINKLDSSIDAYFYQVNIIENKNQKLKEANFSQSKYKLLWLNSIFKFGNNATAKIYKVDFLQNNEIYFDYKNLYHEDLIFTPKLLSKIKKFRIKNLPIYNWHIQKNSLSSTMNTKKLKDLEYIFNKRRQFFKSLEDSYSLKYAKKSEWQFVVWHIWKSKKLYYLFQAFYIFKTKNKVS